MAKAGGSFIGFNLEERQKVLADVLAARMQKSTSEWLRDLLEAAIDAYFTPEEQAALLSAPEPLEQNIRRIVERSARPKERSRRQAQKQAG